MQWLLGFNTFHDIQQVTRQREWFFSQIIESPYTMVNEFIQIKWNSMEWNSMEVILMEDFLLNCSSNGSNPEEWNVKDTPYSNKTDVIDVRCRYNLWILNQLLTTLCHWLSSQNFRYILQMSAHWKRNSHITRYSKLRAFLEHTWRSVKTHKSVLFLLRAVNTPKCFTKNTSKCFLGVLYENAETHKSVFFLLRSCVFPCVYFETFCFYSVGQKWWISAKLQLSSAGI